MATAELDQLLERMERIAKAVNSFSSEAVQQSAFDALIGAFGGVQIAAQSRLSTAEATAHVPADSSDTSQADKPKKARKTKGATSTRDVVEAVRNLDLRPQGKKSFSDFIEEKKPSSNQDKFAVAIYYLEQIAGVSPITMGHVAAVFKQTTGWKESGNIRVGLTSTASRKNTLDTSDLNNLKTTPHGRNFVEHDLPGAGKKTK